MKLLKYNLKLQLHTTKPGGNCNYYILSNYEIKQSRPAAK
jgi:hypothetical protein